MHHRFKRDGRGWVVLRSFFFIFVFEPLSLLYYCLDNKSRIGEDPSFIDQDLVLVQDSCSRQILLVPEVFRDLFVALHYGAE